MKRTFGQQHNVVLALVALLVQRGEARGKVHEGILLQQFGVQHVGLDDQGDAASVGHVVNAQTAHQVLRQCFQRISLFFVGVRVPDGVPVRVDDRWHGWHVLDGFFPFGDFDVFRTPRGVLQHVAHQGVETEQHAKRFVHGEDQNGPDGHLQICVQVSGKRGFISLPVYLEKTVHEYSSEDTSIGQPPNLPGRPRNTPQLKMEISTYSTA